MRIAFIGGGNMATSLIGGLIARGWDAPLITAADPVRAQTARLAAEFGVSVTDDNRAAARDADAIVLAVKPQQLPAVAHEIAAAIADRRRLAISIAAGIRVAELRGWLGEAAAVVRAMPNRPALVGRGITALYCGAEVLPKERDRAAAILGSCGETVWLDAEAQIDIVTAVSGSGPAYFFLLMEALEDAARAHGLPAATARRLAVVTAWGAGEMAARSGDDPATLRAQVTSKGGTTEAALAVLDAAGMRDIFSAAVAAGTRRSAELAATTRGE
jgi:pyrroline-5-carboxylate reductase